MTDRINLKLSDFTTIANELSGADNAGDNHEVRIRKHTGELTGNSLGFIAIRTRHQRSNAEVNQAFKNALISDPKYRNIREVLSAKLDAAMHNEEALTPARIRSAVNTADHLIIAEKLSDRLVNCTMIPQEFRNELRDHVLDYLRDHPDFKIDLSHFKADSETSAQQAARIRNLANVMEPFVYAKLTDRDGNIREDSPMLKYMKPRTELVGGDTQKADAIASLIRHNSQSFYDGNLRNLIWNRINNPFKNAEPTNTYFPGPKMDHLVSQLVEDTLEISSPDGDPRHSPLLKLKTADLNRLNEALMQYDPEDAMTRGRILITIAKTMNTYLRTNPGAREAAGLSTIVDDCCRKLAHNERHNIHQATSLALMQDCLADLGANMFPNAEDRLIFSTLLLQPPYINDLATKLKADPMVLDNLGDFVREPIKPFLTAHREAAELLAVLGKTDGILNEKQVKKFGPAVMPAVSAWQDMMAAAAANPPDRVKILTGVSTLRQACKSAGLSDQETGRLMKELTTMMKPAEAQVRTVFEGLRGAGQSLIDYQGQGAEQALVQEELELIGALGNFMTLNHQELEHNDLPQELKEYRALPQGDHEAPLPQLPGTLFKPASATEIHLAILKMEEKFYDAPVKQRQLAALMQSTSCADYELLDGMLTAAHLNTRNIFDAGHSQSPRNLSSDLNTLGQAITKLARDHHCDRAEVAAFVRTLILGELKDDPQKRQTFLNNFAPGRYGATLVNVFATTVQEEQAALQAAPWPKDTSTKFQFGLARIENTDISLGLLRDLHDTIATDAGQPELSLKRPGIAPLHFTDFAADCDLYNDCENLVFKSMSQFEIACGRLQNPPGAGDRQIVNTFVSALRLPMGARPEDLEFADGHKAAPATVGECVRAPLVETQFPGSAEPELWNFEAFLNLCAVHGQEIAAVLRQGGQPDPNALYQILCPGRGAAPQGITLDNLAEKVMAQYFAEYTQYKSLTGTSDGFSTLLDNLMLLGLTPDLFFDRAKNCLNEEIVIDMDPQKKQGSPFFGSRILCSFSGTEYADGKDSFGLLKDFPRAELVPQMTRDAGSVAEKFKLTVRDGQREHSFTGQAMENHAGGKEDYSRMMANTLRNFCGGNLLQLSAIATCTSQRTQMALRNTWFTGEMITNAEHTALDYEVQKDGDDIIVTMQNKPGSLFTINGRYRIDKEGRIALEQYRLTMPSITAFNQHKDPQLPEGAPAQPQEGLPV